jgi:DNA polymerase-3 subunit delta
VATASGRSSKVKTSVAIPQLGWREARPAAVVLVTGPEEFLAERAITGIRQQLRAADPSLEVSDVDATTYASGQLLTLASPSLFGEPRLIRVSSVEKCSDELIEDVVSYLQAPDADTTLVLRHGGGVRGKKILDTVRLGSGSGIEVIVDELKSDNDKFEFAAAEFAAGERRITPGAVRGLVAAFSSNGAELAAACQQLMSDTTGDIYERDVETY